jgi:tRNA/tmRNA/rRNA uracil-C5-methylase (TrmA/RlmC/RlmD family)
MTTLDIGGIFDVEAHGTSLGGRVVARLSDGRVCFVHGGIPGEQLRIRLTAMKKSFAEADLVEVLTASPDRLAPPCPIYGRCGGCQYQHVAYPRQVELKTRQLTDALQRIGGVRVSAIDEVHASPSPWAYRNRIELHPAGKGYGFVTVDDHTILPITTCPIARPEVNAEIARLPSAAGLAEATRVSIRWAPGNGAVTSLRETPEELPWRLEHVGGKPYAVPTGSFAQVHTEVAEILFKLIGRWLSPLTAQRIIDAYCGAGFLGLAVTDRPVLGLELDASSVEAARQNAETRGLAATHTYLAGNVDALLEAQLAPAAAGTAAPSTCVILDPPRAGCGAGTISALGRQKPAWLLYVSCDPATLARDLKVLMPLGYRVERTALLDMFPQTAHFESVVLLARI